MAVVAAVAAVAAVPQLLPLLLVLLLLPPLHVGAATEAVPAAVGLAAGSLCTTLAGQSCGPCCLWALASSSATCHLCR